MKKTLLSSFSLLASGLMVSQVSFNKAYHTVNEKPNPFVVNIYDAMYFTSQSYDANSFGVNYLYKHNGQGDLVFRSWPLTCAYTHGFKSKDNKLVLAGGGIVCDVPPPQQTNYLAKLDTS